MSERPILFSASMVRAILEGRKTMTRRVLKLPTKTHTGGAIYERPDMGGWEPTTNGGNGCFTIGKFGERTPAPETVGIWHRTCGVCLDAPWQRGDRLWVRETVRAEELEDAQDGIRYLADDVFSPIKPTRNAADAWLKMFYYGGKRGRDRIGRNVPSIHMPRWASRIDLLVEDVRVERLHDITEDDARAEGVERTHPSGLPDESERDWGRQKFAALWRSIHPEQIPVLDEDGRKIGMQPNPARWNANPWVVAVSFTRVPA